MFLKIIVLKILGNFYAVPVSWFDFCNNFKITNCKPGILLELTLIMNFYLVIYLKKIRKTIFQKTSKELYLSNRVFFYKALRTALPSKPFPMFWSKSRKCTIHACLILLYSSWTFQQCSAITPAPPSYLLP